MVSRLGRQGRQHRGRWLLVSDETTLRAEDRSKSIPTKAQPAGLAATASAVYVPTASGLEIHPTSGSSAVHPGAVTAAAAFGGSGEDMVAFGSGPKVTLATANGTSIKVLCEISDNRGEILVLAFSKDGSLLASGDVSPVITDETQADM